jgi:hypothetical protein
MRIHPLILVLLLCGLVAGCATRVNTRQALDQAAVGALSYGQVDVTSGVSNMTPEDMAQLKQVVTERLATLPQGPRPVTLRLAVTEFAISTGATRLLIGAFAGANKMTVGVSVIDGSGQSLAAFDVQRSANPGGYGVFYDQKAATMKAVADGVAEALSSAAARSQ